MSVVHGVNELNVDPHLVVGFLHAAFDDVHDPELPGDFTQVRRRAFEALG